MIYSYVVLKVLRREGVRSAGGAAGVPTSLRLQSDFLRFKYSSSRANLSLIMHIAIAVWGLMRSLPFTIESFREMCLKPIVNQGHTYELFVHTYNFSGSYINLRSKETPVQLNFSDWKLLGADEVLIENQDAFNDQFPFQDYMSKGDPWKSNFTSFKNHLRALHSLHQVTLAVESASKWTHFDGVAFLRPDVLYLNELPISLLSTYPDTLFLPNFHRNCAGGQYNDRMVLADVTSALTYGKKLDSALEYSKTHLLHSETFTYDYLTKKGVRVKEIPFVFRRVRSTGLVHGRDKALQSPEEFRLGHHSHQSETPLLWSLLYSALEVVTFHQVYIWNHDDDNNQECTPNPFVSYEECLQLQQAALEAAHFQVRSRKNKEQMMQLYYSRSAAVPAGLAAGAKENEKRRLRHHNTKVQYVRK